MPSLCVVYDVVCVVYYDVIIVVIVVICCCHDACVNGDLLVLMNYMVVSMYVGRVCVG